MTTKEKIIEALEEKKGCGKEVYMDDNGMEENGVWWKCGEQFNTDIIFYCKDCEKGGK